MLGDVDNFFVLQSLLPTAFAFTLQENFPAHDLNFHWGWWNQIQATFYNLFYFNKTLKTYNYFLADDVYLEQQAQAQVEQQKQSNEYLMMGQQYYNYEAAGKKNYKITLN